MPRATGAKSAAEKSAAEMSSAQTAVGEIAVGDEIDLEIGNVGHGGVCVARADGRVVFVRYALPGERARVRITDAKHGSYCRGDAIEILRADPRRVAPPCAHFGPGGCGGCDWQHAAPDLQRELKASVVAEQLRRLAGIDWPVVVEPLPGDGLGWRSRVRWAVSDRGGDVVLGPRRYRSHDVIPLSADAPCLIAAEPITATALAAVRPGAGPGAGRRAGSGAGRPAGSAADEAVVVAQGGDGAAIGWLRRGRMVRGIAASTVTERAVGRDFDVDVAGFWQAHRDAAEVLSTAVADALRSTGPSAGAPSGGSESRTGRSGGSESGVGDWLRGRSAWDLYGGVGLFAAVLADAVGPDGRVVSVESDRAASHHARANLADVPQVTVAGGRVEQVLGSLPGHVDAIVLDPPRSGAGRAVCTEIATRRAAVIVYVACDPAALARDAAILADGGYRLTELRAFDAFPQTHHVECVASFVPTR